MKVFVTGGTGTIGNVLVQNLLTAGHFVKVITRNRENVSNLWKDQVELIEGDVTSKGEWLDALDDVDGIINLVGESVFDKRWSSKQKDRIYHSRIDPTTILVEKVQSMEKSPSVFVSVSGADYYPSSKTEVYSEEDEPGDSFLSKVTQDWEEPVRKLENTEVRHVILRMGGAFTHSGNAIEKMFLPHKFFIGGWIGSGNQIIPWIHIDDFAGLLQWGLENDHVEGTYNGVAPEYKTMKELATIGGKIMGRWTWTWVPGIILKIVLGERSELLLKGRAASAEKVLNAGYKFRYPTPEKALEDILEDF